MRPGELTTVTPWRSANPLRGDADAVVGRVAFFNERVDIVVDDAAGDRPDSEFFEEGWHEGTAR